MKSIMKNDITIIGAGAAGLFLGSRLSSENKTVMLEKNRHAGRKLLLTGNGQCNITNSADIKSFTERFGANGKSIRQILYRYNNISLVNYFTKNGVELVTRDDGKIFPASHLSSQIRNQLVRDCQNNKINIIYNTTVRNITYKNSMYIISTDNGEYRSSLVAITAGGYSYPHTGSTGDGYSLAKSLGHTIITPKPALAPLNFSKFQYSDLSGISVEGINLSIWRRDKKILSLTGDLLFTSTGLSGPVILHMSRYTELNDQLEINLLGKSSDNLKRELQEASSTNGKQSLKNFMRRYNLPSKLISLVLKEHNISDDIPLAQLKREERILTVNALTALRLNITKLPKFDNAMTTAGGVNLDEIDLTTMESKIIPGLYFAGEIVDIDGDSGGYNLQFAYSSACAAADDINRRMKHE